MQSKALYFLATTSGLCLRRIIAFQSAVILQGRVLPSSATSSLVSFSMSRGSTTSAATSTSAISAAADRSLFQFSNPSNAPTPTPHIVEGDMVRDNDADLLLQRRPFVIVEGQVVRDDIIRALHRQQLSSEGTANIADDDLSSCFFSSDNFTSKHFLTSFPSGAYTTSRTVKAQRVLRLGQHLSRMAESARLMIGAQLQQSGDTRPTADQNGKGTKAWQGDKFLTDGRKILATDVIDGLAEDSVRSMVRRSLASGIASFEHLYPASTHMEKRITTLLLWERCHANVHDDDGAQKISGTGCDEVVLETIDNDDGDNYQRGHLRLRVLSYVELLPSPPTGRIIAQLCRTQRANALAKDSQWVNDRRALERQKLPTNPPVHEVLLTSERKVGADRFAGGTLQHAQIGVLEGLSSNFFAITQDGMLYTASAEEGVLLGTLRAIVIRVCEENGIEVREEAPLLPDFFKEGNSGGRDSDSDGRRWVGAFISSTTRLALPLTDLIVPSSTATYAGDNTVDIIRFSYGGMDGHDIGNGNGNDSDGSSHKNDVAESLGLVVGEVQGGNGTEENGGVVPEVPYKVGKCINVDDSKGTMKLIIEGVNSAVLDESERPW